MDKVLEPVTALALGSRSTSSRRILSILVSVAFCEANIPVFSQSFVILV